MSIDHASLVPLPLERRRWLPVVVLAALLIVVVTGGYVTSDALGKAGGDTVTVSPSVSVVAPPGWEVADRFSDPVGVRLTSGGTSLVVLTAPFTGTNVDLLSSFERQVLEPHAVQFRVSQDVRQVRLASGLTGSRITYIGRFGDVQAPIEGVATAVVSPSDLGVIFDGWAPTGQLRFAIDDIDTMVEQADIA